MTRWGWSVPALCRERTPFWYTPKDVALCHRCAKTATKDKLPTKDEWVAKERELRKRWVGEWTMTVKPDTMCTEVGCTRDWTVEITEDALVTTYAPTSATARKRGLCPPCAEMRKRVRAMAASQSGFGEIA